MDESPPESGTAKRVLILLAALVLVIGVCVARTDDAIEEPGALPPTQSTDERFVSFIRDRIPGASSKTDAELIAAGHELCDRFDQGLTTDQIAVAGVIQGFDFQEMGDAIVAAIRSYCPEHVDLIE